MRPYFCAYSLLMNLTAKMGVCSRFGAAFLILRECQSYFEAFESSCGQAQLPCICASTDRLGDDAEGYVVCRQRRQLRVLYTVHCGIFSNSPAGVS